MTEHPEAPALITQVIAAAAQASGVPAAAVPSPDRTSGVVMARTIAAWLFQRHCPWLSTTQIARALGWRSHSAAVHALQRARWTYALHGCYRVLCHRAEWLLSQTQTAPQP